MMTPWFLKLPPLLIETMYDVDSKDTFAFPTSEYFWNRDKMEKHFEVDRFPTFPESIIFLFMDKTIPGE